MPVLAIIGLVFSAIRLAMALADWVRSHPQVPAHIADALNRAYGALEEASTHVEPHIPPEAP